MLRRVHRYALAGAVVVLAAVGTFTGIQLASRPAASHPNAATTPSGSSSAKPSPSPLPGGNITGPLNLLVIGVDTRESIPTWIPHSDAIMILHVDKTLTHAYLTSLPRDLVVNIPAYAPSHYPGGRTKLTHAMAFGSMVPGSNRANTMHGYDLLSKTISAYTGIPHFDGGAVLTFSGLRRLVNALGGIDLYVDQKVVSIHLQPNGLPRKTCGGCAHGYSGPQATYNVGLHHFVGWQALDYARQRYIAGSDYARQRHQRQVIRAIVAKAFSGNMFSDPARFLSVLTILDGTLTFDGKGKSAVDLAFGLRHLTAGAITLVGLPGAGVYHGSTYLGEALAPVQSTYFAALRQDQLASFVATHANLVNR